MTEADMAALTDEAVSARARELYFQTQVAGCPREVTLEYQRFEDEEERRYRASGEAAVLVACYGDDFTIEDAIAMEEYP